MPAAQLGRGRGAAVGQVGAGGVSEEARRQGARLVRDTAQTDNRVALVGVEPLGRGVASIVEDEPRHRVVTEGPRTPRSPPRREDPGPRAAGGPCTGAGVLHLSLLQLHHFADKF